MPLRAAVALVVLLCGACASKPFDVKVVPKVEPDAIGAPAALGPLGVRAEAVWDQVWLLENFDANLVLADVLPVRADLANTSDVPVETRKLRFSAVDASGREFKLLSTKKARKAIEKYYGIAIRSKTGDKLYKEDFAANALELERPLAPGERRQGFLFFAIPKGVGGQVPITLTVTSKKRDVSVQVKL